MKNEPTVRDIYIAYIFVSVYWIKMYMEYDFSTGSEM